MGRGPKRYAKVEWTIEDLKSICDMSDRQAHAFMKKNARILQDHLVACGWDILANLLQVEGYQPKAED